MNEKGALNGIARVILKQGLIMEGQFKDGEPNGWIREVYQEINSPSFRVYWCVNDTPHGYFYQQDYDGEIDE